MALRRTRVFRELERAAGGPVHLDEARPSRVMLLADTAEVLVVLRLHELLAGLPALAHQFLGVGFEVLELVELGVGAVDAGAGERVGVHGGVVAAGGLGVALGSRAVVFYRSTVLTPAKSK